MRQQWRSRRLLESIQIPVKNGAVTSWGRGLRRSMMRVAVVSTHLHFYSPSVNRQSFETREPCSAWFGPTSQVGPFSTMNTQGRLGYEHSATWREGP